MSDGFTLDDPQIEPGDPFALVAMPWLLRCLDDLWEPPLTEEERGALRARRWESFPQGWWFLASRGGGGTHIDGHTGEGRRRLRVELGR